VLPLRDDVAARSAPLVVISLIAVLAAAFAGLLTISAPEEAAALVERWGLVPRAFRRALVGAPDALWLTPLTAIFLHGGWLHLLGNALYLWIFGRALEDLLGRGRLLLLFLVSGLVAGLVHVAASPQSWVPAIGASGAVSGLLGAYAVSYPGGRLRLLWPPVRVPAIVFLLAWIAFQLVSGVSSWGSDGGGIAWWAHVGGFCAGAALARPMWLRPPRRGRVGI